MYKSTLVTTTIFLEMEITKHVHARLTAEIGSYGKLNTCIDFDNVK